MKPQYQGELARVERYSALSYRVTVEPVSDEAGSYYLATHPELPGCVADGDTRQEAEANLALARHDYIAALLKQGLTIPVPAPSVTVVEGPGISNENPPPMSIESAAPDFAWTKQKPTLILA